MSRIIDITGNKYNKLTVLRLAYATSDKKHTYWKCRCDCGTEIILRKDDQLKLMVNFSKEINKEYKSNVAELTKQAVKTIKVFYNTLNNNAKNTIDNGYRVEFKNSATTFENFEPTLKNKKTCFG